MADHSSWAATAIGTFDWASLATYLIAVMGLVLLVDALSAALRRRLL